MPYDIRYVEQPPTAFALAYRQDPMGTLRTLAGLGADAVVLPDLRNRQLMFVSHPDLYGEVFIRHVDAFVKARALQLARHVLGNGLLTSEEPHHGRMRRLVLPAFHHARLRRYGEVMVRRAVEGAAAWAEGTPFDLHRAMMGVTVNVAVETLFGTTVEDEVEPVVRGLEAGFRVYDMNTNAAALHGGAGARTAREALDRAVNRFIARRRARPEDTGDLLSMLLAAQDEETGLALTDLEVLDEAINLLVAGYETNAVALTCTLWALAGHPAVQERLHAEVDAVLGGRPATFDDLPHLAYTRQVFSEGMRLYPPTWVQGREATREVEVGGVALAPKSTVVLSAFTLHRDGRWWEEPEAFRPERFTAEAKRARPKFAYLPFGVGQRGCIGEPFAWAEGTLVLATLAQRWRFYRAMPALGLFAGIVLRPEGEVLVRVERRTHARPRTSAAVPAEAA
jgi:cytochrome P450